MYSGFFRGVTEGGEHTAFAIVAELAPTGSATFSGAGRLFCVYVFYIVIVFVNGNDSFDTCCATNITISRAMAYRFASGSFFSFGNGF